MQTKLFVGTRLTPELQNAASTFTTVRHEGKAYLGTYLDEPEPTLTAIKTASDTFLLTLQELCPHSRTLSLPVVVFPQLFVG